MSTLSIIYEDIWAAQQKHGWATVVIPTNVGWNKYGENIMGGGLALQAKQKFPQLPGLYGSECMIRGDDAVVHYPEYQLILAPTKKLNDLNPAYSWHAPSTLEFVTRTLIILNDLVLCENLPKVLIPAMGCGLGSLRESQVIPLMNEYLDSTRFTLCLC